MAPHIMDLPNIKLRVLEIQPYTARRKAVWGQKPQ